MARKRGRVTPELTRWFGRDGDMALLRALLAEDRKLVTLTGPGGVGKTRLAKELLFAVHDTYDPEATAFVELDQVAAADQDDINEQVVAALDINFHESDQDRTRFDVLVEKLHGRKGLLVLDNCEHLSDAAGEFVAALVEDVPSVTVLVTSRSPLHLPYEYLLPVRPLDLPRECASRAQAETSKAVELFLDRAAAAGRVIGDDDAEWPAIVELVRSTAGVALALEMLAARLRTLTPEMVLEMGKEVVTWRFPSGTKRVSAPHMSMLKTVAQSWNTCDPREQRLWARLSTFVGGFTVQATREVCFDEDVSVDEVLELLESLVLKSVVVPPSREGRYSQHAYLREYGQRMLNEQFDEVDELRERHSLWAARSARHAAATWFGPDEVGTLKANHADLHNYRAAVVWCKTPDRVGRGLDILNDYCRVRSQFFFSNEIQLCGWYDELLAVGPPDPTVSRISAVAMLGWMRTVLGDRTRGLQHLEECNALVAEAGLTGAVPPPALMLQGTYRTFIHNDPLGLDLLAAAAAGFGAVGAEGDKQMALLLRAVSAGLMGPAGVADAAAKECLKHAQGFKAPWAEAWAEMTLGLPALTEPQDVLRRCLKIVIELGDAWAPTWVEEWEALRRAAMGDSVSAAKLLGGSIKHQRDHGVLIVNMLPFAMRREQAVQQIIADIGEILFKEHYDAGQRLTTEALYELALAEPGTTTQLLTPRLVTVAKLVSEGLKNSEIADRLGIETRSVEKYVSDILRELKLENRRQVAQWFKEAGG